MPRNLPLFLAVPLLLALLVTACAPTTMAPTATVAEEKAEQKEQKKLVFKRRLRDYTRVYQAGFPILRDAVSFCGTKVGAGYGFTTMTENDVESEERDIAKEAFGLKSAPTVLVVVEGSPADKGGLRKGDWIKTVNGMPLTSASTGDLFAQPNKRERMTELMNAAPAGPVKLTVMRAEGTAAAVEIDVEITPIKICNYSFTVENKDEIGAFADGTRIVFTTGILRFFETDTELYTVMAHELAHNAMGHIDAGTTNARIGGGFGLAMDILAAVAGVNTQGQFMKLGASAGRGAFSQSFEAEADYVGLYIMAKAGKNYKDAADFWRRMGAASPGSIEHASSHPTTAARFVAMKKAIAEIDRKIAAGKPLEPEKKRFDVSSNAGPKVDPAR